MPQPFDKSDTPRESWDSDDLMPPISLPKGVSAGERSRHGADGRGARRESNATSPQPSGPEGAPKGESENIGVPRPQRPVDRASRAARGAEIVRVTTDASMMLRRGEKAEARRAVMALLETAPDSAAALELLGDIEMADGRVTLANEAFRKSVKAEPGRSTAELKLARSVLRQTEAMRQKSIGVAYAGSSDSAAAMAGVDPKFKVWLASGLSCIIPGAGQVVNGEFVKGAVILAGSLVLAGVLVWLPDVGDVNRHLQRDLAALSSSSTVGVSAPHISVAFWLVLGLSAALWTYALVDAVRVAKGDSIPAVGPKIR